MEITLGLFLLLFFIALLCELVDSSLGMGYGTILSPLLLIMGFSPLIAVPSILISQACASLCAGIFHQKFNNASFHHDSKDLKITIIVSSFGIIATLVAATIAVKVPALYLKTYIGLLVTIMGVIIFINKKFSFSWRKIIGLGILSAFNKALSGGGFGPVVTSGQILSGQKHKNAIAVTTMAEVPICIIAFFTFLIARTAAEVEQPLLTLSLSSFISHIFSPKIIQWELILALLAGSVLVAPLGALVTKKLNEKIIHLILGSFVCFLGIMTLTRTYLGG